MLDDCAASASVGASLATMDEAMAAGLPHLAANAMALLDPVHQRPQRLPLHPR